MSGAFRVLIVDDSVVTRQALADALRTIPGVEVAGRAASGEEALRLGEVLAPDLVTLDLEMPGLDGFALLRLLLARRRVPVIVVSSQSGEENVFRALDLGALDFVAKATSREDDARMRAELRAKVAAVMALRPVPRAAGSGTQRPDTGSRPPRPPTARPPRRVVVVAASMGGPAAVRELIAALPRGTGLGVVVAMHMPARYTRAYAQRLAARSQVACAEAEEGRLVTAGTAWVAPGARVTEVAADPQGLGVLRVLAPSAEDRYAPSADRLFRSAAEAFGARTLALVLTGMGEDGLAGIAAVRAQGGEVWAEDPSSALVDGMPAAARESGLASMVLSLSAMTARLAVF